MSSTKQVLISLDWRLQDNLILDLKEEIWSAKNNRTANICIDLWHQAFVEQIC